MDDYNSSKALSCELGEEPSVRTGNGSGNAQSVENLAEATAETIAKDAAETGAETAAKDVAETEQELTQAMINQGNQNCAVCLHQQKCGDLAIVLSCDHAFHKDSVKPWLEGHTTCPVCRANVDATTAAMPASQREAERNPPAPSPDAPVVVAVVAATTATTTADQPEQPHPTTTKTEQVTAEPKSEPCFCGGVPGCPCGRHGAPIDSEVDVC